MGNGKIPRRWWLLAAAGAAALCLIQHPALLWRGLCLVGEALLPFGLGLCFAFILNVPLGFIEERLFAGKKVRRGWTLALTCLLAAGLLGVLLFLILPQLQKSAALLVERLPGYLAELQRWAEGAAARLGPQAEEFVAKAEEAVREWGEGFAASGPEMVRSTVDAAAGFFQGAVNLLAGLVFSIYLLARKEALCLSSKRVLFAVLPQKAAVRLAEVGRLTARTFRKFVSGQLTEAMLLGAMCFVGMALFRMPYAPLISAIVGVTALIPIFGAIFGGAAGALILLMERPVLALWFLIFLIVLQQFENNFLYPKVVGESIGLPGLWVLLAVTAGGSAFGVAGMLLGIPAASVAYTLFREWVARRLRERRLTRREIEAAGERDWSEDPEK